MGLHSKRGKHNRTEVRKQLIENQVMPALEKKYEENLAIIRGDNVEVDMSADAPAQPESDSIAEEVSGRSKLSQKAKQEAIKKAVSKKKKTRLQKKRLAGKKKK